MDFISPSVFWLLLGLPVIGFAYIWAQRRRQVIARRFTSLLLPGQALVRNPGIRSHIPPALFLVALATMVGGLARPEMTVKLPTNDATIMLAIDVSGSMRADDVHPTRMEAAKAAAKEFVNYQSQGIRIGVVSFSDDAVLVQPPTTDRLAVIAAIDRLEALRGTAIGSGLETAFRAIQDTQGIAQAASADLGNSPGSVSETPKLLPQNKGASQGVIVLLTDGENNEGPEPTDVAKELATQGIRIYTIGLGSAKGADLVVDGEVVHVSFDEASLQQTASTTGGSYFNAVTETDLQKVFQNLAFHLDFTTQKTEMTFGLTAAAAILSLVAGALSFFWARWSV